MNISRNCLDLIKHFEGCRLAAYLCPAQVWTVGYGHTGPDVKAGQCITQAKADELLTVDVARFVRGVDNLVTVELSQGQFDSLVSFAFNLGLGNLQKSTLLKLVNAGRFDAAAGEFVKWNKAGGKVLAGLTKRREAEAHLFRTSTLRLAA